MMRKGVFLLVACLASLACPTGGAWSAPPPTVSCVDPGGGGDYTDLQAALTAAESNADSDLIKVAQGTYAGNFVYESDSGYALWVYGGYEPGTGCGDRDLDPANTILDGGGAGGALDLHDSSGADMKVDGLTLQNGGGPAGYYGGGIKAVSENDKTAGMVNSGHVTITNSIVAGNAAISNGGGIYASSQSIAGTAGDVVLSNNRIHGNSAADYDGGGVLAESYSLSGTAGDVILKNNLVYENSAGRFGEAVAAYSRAPSGTPGSVTLVNNTITENCDSGVCYGFFASAGTVYCYNNILWGNTDLFGADVYLNPDVGTAHGYNNDYAFIFGSWGFSSDNIQVDPLLAGNHRLRPSSPCIDSGTNTAPGLPATDLDGDARILNDTVDMGADEFKARALVPYGLLLL